MSHDIRYLVGSTVLAWLMVMTAAALRTRYWTFGGMLVALGNRDDVPEPRPAAARADRAARNMLENLLLFAILFFAARQSGVVDLRLERAAALFFWARLAYFPVYLAGVRYLRTALWALGVVAMLMIVLALL